MNHGPLRGGREFAMILKAADLTQSMPREFYFEGPGEGARTIRLEQIDREIVVSRRFSDGTCLVDETSERFKMAEIDHVAEGGDRIVLTLKGGPFRKGKKIAF